MEQFLITAWQQQTKVDLFMSSGREHLSVLVTDVQDGCAEVRVVENRVARLYVVCIHRIESAVRSRSQK